MKAISKSISALLLATITMAPAAVPAASYNDSVKTIFSHLISNVPGKSLVAVEVSYPLVAPLHRTDIRCSSMRTSCRVRSRAR
jgi:hypothetical protein